MIPRAFLTMAIAATVACGGGSDDDGSQTPSDAPRGTTSEPRAPAQAADDGRLTREVQGKLVACSLLAGEGTGRGDVVVDGYDRCYGRCALGASCDDLVAHTCRDHETSFAECVHGCPTAPADGFVCTNGMRIAHVAVCDGEEDCRAGEDEADCAPRCADGVVLESDELQCDGKADCADGSDELGCLTCPDGGG